MVLSCILDVAPPTENRGLAFQENGHEMVPTCGSKSHVTRNIHFSGEASFQHRSSLIPASFQHCSSIVPASFQITPASLQHLSSIVQASIIYPAWFQHHSSLVPASFQHRPSIVLVPASFQQHRSSIMPASCSIVSDRALLPTARRGQSHTAEQSPSAEPPSLAARSSTGRAPRVAPVVSSQ